MQKLFSEIITFAHTYRAESSRAADYRKSGGAKLV